jgi:putative cardiolipin synthase
MQPERCPTVIRPALLLLGLLLGGCAVTPPGPPHSVASTALADPASTDLGKLFTPLAAAHPGQSGFELVISGREAFAGRYAVAAAAQKTIDVQYFLWNGDATGRQLLSALLDAADRGVRVRMLLDDIELAGKDTSLAVLNAHRNIEVRLFNPFDWRMTHLPDFLLDFARINHRMHNKAFIVDNAVAIVGGRNIGDPYFSANDQSNFRDVDLFAAGPIVQQVSANFDAFWNSPWARSIHGIDRDDHPSPEDVEKQAGRITAKIAQDQSFPFADALDPAQLGRLVQQLPARLVWGEARLLADLPDKPQTSEPGVLDQLKGEIGGTLESSLIIEAAYFIPADRGVASLCRLRQRGVQIVVLTNSARTNDEMSAYAAYSKYRKDLLRCGVKLYELRPDAGFIHKQWTWVDGRSTAALHTKATVFDHRRVLIGSFNLDPRSKNLNTEMAVLIDSPVLAQHVENFITTGMEPENAYRLELDDDRLVWIAQNDGETQRFVDEPDLGFWRGVGVDILSLLPIEGQM